MTVLHTRLDGFLRLVELDEDAAAAEHGAAIREVMSAKGRVEELKLELRRDRRQRGPSQEWMVIELERQRLVEDLKLAEQRVLAVEQIEQAKRQGLVAAHQKAETIRHAIDRMRGEKLRALSRQESRALDEIAISRHTRRATG